MQKVTSTPNQVALNAQIEVNNAENSSNQVSSNILSRIAGAALSAITTVVKTIYDVVMWVPNKVYNLLYPTASNETDIEVQQDTVVASLYDANEVDAENDIPNPVIADGEELPEPVSTASNWKKAAVIGGAVVGGLAAAFGLACATEYFYPNQVTGPVSSFGTNTVPSYFTHVWTVLNDTLCDWTGFSFPNPSSYTNG